MRARDATRLAAVVVLGPAELEGGARELEGLCGAADAVSRAAPPTLLTGILAGAAAYVGNDSGVTHLAAACGTPTVAVFGPTDPSVWAPRGAHVRVLRGTGPRPVLERVSAEDVTATLRSLVRLPAR